MREGEEAVTREVPQSIYNGVSAGPHRTGSSTPRARVLVVDDDSAIRRMVARIVEREDFTTEMCGDGVSALAQIKREWFDVIVLDVTMPGMSGYDVVDALRAENPDALRRVILMTAAVRRREDVGVFAVLLKPFDIGELTRLVRSCAAFQRDEAVAIASGDA